MSNSVSTAALGRTGSFTASELAGTRKRLPRTALLLGTALGCSIAVVALGAPNAAWAANECGAVVNSAGTDTATCTSAGNTYPGGITYIEGGLNNLSVVLDSGVVVTTTTNDGVVAQGATNYDVSITTASGDTITSSLNGVYAVTSGTGDAAVTNGADVSAYGRGLTAIAQGSGDASVVNTGNITVKDELFSDYAAAIVAGALGGGDVYVNNSGALNVTNTVGYAVGIYGATAGGDVTIFNSGDMSITAAGSAYGIRNTSVAVTADDVYINNSGNMTVTSTGTGNAYGVLASGTGDVTIINTGTTTVSAQSGEAAGVNAFAGGDLNVTVGNISATSATGYAVGVYANATGNTSVSGSGSIYASGNKAVGVYAYSETGTVTVNVGNVTSNSSGVGTYGDQGVGIRAVGPGDVSVTAGNVVVSGTFAYGITAHSTGGDVSITAGSITTTGDYGVGIYETAENGNVALSVSHVTTSGYDASAVFARGKYNVALNTGYVTTTGDDSRGIYANSYDGNASVVSNDVSTSGNGSSGIDVYGRYGASVVAVSTITTGADSVGINADSDYGNASVVTSYVRTEGNDSDAISVYGNHSAYVHNEGYVETTGVGSTGIDASSGYGPTTVVSHTVITSGDDANGINAYAYQGNVSVTSGIVVTHGNYSFGIDATAYTGDVNVNSGTVVTYGHYAPGVIAMTKYGDVSVTSGYVGTHGDISPGVVALAYDGNVSVNSGTVRTYGNYSPGVVAATYAGNVSVTSNFVETHGYLSPGVLAAALTGDVSVTSGSSFTYGNDSAAIFAITGTGNVSVTTTGDTEAYGLGSDAIDAITVAAGNVTVNSGGYVYSEYGVGVHVHSAGYATVNNSGSTYGSEGGVVVYSADGVTINNGVGAVIRGGGGYAIGTYGGGSTVINNSGIIDGFAYLATSNNTVNNFDTWNAYGNSYFGPAGNNVFNNGPGGTVHVAPFSSSATTVVWNGLAAFNNEGLVDLRNGHTGDVFDLPGTTFTGSVNSTLAVDASLSSALSADELIIGPAAGTTQVIVNNVGGPPALNFVGVPVVQATSGSAGAFVMAPIHDGFVDYGLSFNSATTTWNLVGLPGQPAFEFLKVPEMAEGFWRRTGDAWSAREQEIRDSMWGSDTPTRGEGWEMWSQAQIGGERLGTNNQTFTVQGFTFTPNLRTDTDWRGFQMGADTLHGGWLWGFTGGFLEQNTIFHFDRNSLDMTGWNFGAYTGFTSGHFFVNGLLKGDWYDLKSNMPTVPAYETFNGNTWGVKGEAGFRFGGHGLYIEPVADAAWTSTHLDDANFHGLNTDFTFSNNTMARGSIGARIGSEWGSVLPYIGIYAVDEWDDNARLTMITGGGCPGACMSIEDEHPGSYGKVDFGFTTKSWNGLEGFLKGEDEFGSHIDGFIGRLGVRWRW
ncbi:MAG TPA: hypothetical protein VGL66_03690 [Caulobacteraceae bacterium]